MSEFLATTGAADQSCPLPATKFAVIRLGHGSGGKMTCDLIESVFLPELGNDILSDLDDAAVVDVGGTGIAVTTDSYVVSPICFPGGDIGSLAVHGTINDLCMRGATPLYLTISFILEEGLPIEELRRIARSVRQAAEAAGTPIVAADTKVVNRGAADRLFITTTGVGRVVTRPLPAANRAAAGDVVIVSGDLGMHGMAIMCAREGLELETTITSDSAPLHGLVSRMMAASTDIHCLRDLTRGGLSSALNEIAAASGVGIELEESAIPVHPEVKAACEILGLDPLYVACEGRLAAVLPESEAPAVLAAMQGHDLGPQARLIGRAVCDHPGKVVLRSLIGGRRILDKLSGEQLPRIC